MDQWILRFAELGDVSAETRAAVEKSTSSNSLSFLEMVFKTGISKAPDMSIHDIAGHVGCGHADLAHAATVKTGAVFL